MDKAAALSQNNGWEDWFHGARRTKRSGVKKMDKYPVNLHKILNFVFVQLFGGRPVATSMERKDTV